MAQKIREMMTANPLTVQPDEPVSEAAKRMKEAGVGDVIVMSDNGVAGILTDRDIVVRGVAEGRDPAKTKISDVMTGDLVTLSPEDSADDAVKLMRERAIRRLPIVENGRPVGVVSIGDLAVERDRDSALADISAAPDNN